MHSFNVLIQNEYINVPGSRLQDRIEQRMYRETDSDSSLLISERFITEHVSMNIKIDRYIDVLQINLWTLLFRVQCIFFSQKTLNIFCH